MPAPGSMKPSPFRLLNEVLAVCAVSSQVTSLTPGYVSFLLPTQWLPLLPVRNQAAEPALVWSDNSAVIIAGCGVVHGELAAFARGALPDGLAYVPVRQTLNRQSLIPSPDAQGRGGGGARPQRPKAPQPRRTGGRRGFGPSERRKCRWRLRIPMMSVVGACVGGGCGLASGRIPPACATTRHRALGWLCPVVVGRGAADMPSRRGAGSAKWRPVAKISLTGAGCSPHNAEV